MIVFLEIILAVGAVFSLIIAAAGFDNWPDDGAAA